MNRNEGDPPQDEDESRNAVRCIMTIVRNSILGQILRNLTEELFPWLYNKELLKNSVHRFCTSLKTEPCSTLFYLLLMVFGFIPFICFFLFIGGSFILTIVWFAVCQAVVVTVSALMFGGFMVFLIIMCCSIAGVFGLIIHTVYGWGSISKLLTELLQASYEYVHNKFEEYGIAHHGQLRNDLSHQG